MLIQLQHQQQKKLKQRKALSKKSSIKRCLDQFQRLGEGEDHNGNKDKKTFRNEINYSQVLMSHQDYPSKSFSREDENFQGMKNFSSVELSGHVESEKNLVRNEKELSESLDKNLKFFKFNSTDKEFKKDYYLNNQMDNLKDTVKKNDQEIKYQEDLKGDNFIVKDHSIFSNKVSSKVSESISRRKYSREFSRTSSSSSSSFSSTKRKSGMRKDKLDDENYRVERAKSFGDKNREEQYLKNGVIIQHQKRKQVKRACMNCQKACKGCSDNRPCPRCILHGLSDTCFDAPRKSEIKRIKLLSNLSNS
ncbi:expressed protein [Phakopsora pachyrhizi]|uniref:Expressed protein n=1 Tax=Phakopsora pachyrhizi TaxID=170000 RepID=A0AAV0BM15_PHAPC|nr:expressed protein [Phakopsora pachyrhizi]